MSIRLLHVHASESYHDDAYLIMNRQGMARLKMLLNKAIHDGHAVAEFTPNDGETFPLHVILDDSDWQSPTWQKRAVGYVDETTRNCQGETAWPMSEFGYYDSHAKRIVKSSGLGR